MHRELKALLEKAVGEPEFVIAVNIDIRGFSSFSMKVESSESAVSLKNVSRKSKIFPALGKSDMLSYASRKSSLRSDLLGVQLYFPVHPEK